MRRTLLAVGSARACPAQALLELPAEFARPSTMSAVHPGRGSARRRRLPGRARGRLATPQSVSRPRRPRMLVAHGRQGEKTPTLDEGCAHHLEDGGSFVVKYEELSDAALAEPAAAPLVGAWRTAWSTASRRRRRCMCT